MWIKGNFYTQLFGMKTSPSIMEDISVFIPIQNIQEHVHSAAGREKRLCSRSCCQSLWVAGQEGRSARPGLESRGRPGRNGNRFPLQCALFGWGNSNREVRFVTSCRLSATRKGSVHSLSDSPALSLYLVCMFCSMGHITKTVFGRHYTNEYFQCNVYE